MSKAVKNKYTLVLSKEGAPQFGWDNKFSVIENLVDVVWTGVCTRNEAYKRFYELVKKQSYEFHETKTLKNWRVVRLYDSSGVQICQES
ncbi:MAG: hypothetical protein J6S00_02755 [Clostridia bacterium]|nr:hypothetical protein [Clostridia bacterium]